MEQVAKQPHKLWIVFTSLDPEEKAHFHRWLKAELGGKGKYIQLLADEIMQVGNTPFSKMALWNSLYPGHAYNDGRIRKLMRDLMAYLEEFLAIQSFRKNRSQLNLHMLKELRERKLPHEFQKYYRKLQRKQVEMEVRDSAFYQMEYELAYELATFRLKYEHGVQALPIQALTQAFDAWWIHKKVELACTNISASAIVGTQAQIPLLNQAVATLRAHPDFENMALFKLLWKLYQLINEEHDGEEIEIQDLLLNASSQLSMQHKREIFSLLSNHFIRRLNQSGSEELAQNIFTLYAWAVDEEILLHHNVLHWQQFKNIISIGLRTQNFSTVEAWLEELSPLLEPQERHDAYIFNRSQYCLEKGEFEEVIELLKQAQFKKVVYEIPARAALLQAHYELYGPYEAWLLSQLENLIRYVKTQKLSETYKASYLNRFKLFRKLIKAEAIQDLKELEQEVHNTLPLSRPEWLLQKIEERKQHRTFSSS